MRIMNMNMFETWDLAGELMLFRVGLFDQRSIPPEEINSEVLIAFVDFGHIRNNIQQTA